MTDKPEPIKSAYHSKSRRTISAYKRTAERAAGGVTEGQQLVSILDENKHEVHLTHESAVELIAQIVAALDIPPAIMDIMVKAKDSRWEDELK